MAMRPADLYRAVWRWHFYAGLLVLPFLISLAVTGGLYLFRDEIDAVIHADLKRVAVSNDIATPSTMVAAALANTPGKAVKFTTPSTPDSSAEVTILTGGGEKRAVYVNPHDGRALGSLPDQGTIMWTIRKLHSLKYFGPWARYAIEIAGGWSILLVGTGLYLWWPRQQSGGVVSVRGRPRQRIFWRDVHAVTGVFVGGFIVFLAVTGMPWSSVWGAKVNDWANGSNYGYPSGFYVDVPMSGEHLNHKTQTGWSTELTQVPESQAGMTMTPITLDAAVSTFDRLGLAPGYAVNIPSDAHGVFTGSVFPDDLSKQRVVHLDQYSGAPLIDLSYADFGPFAKAMEWGINVHMGQEFGRLNQIVLALACVAIVGLAVSAAIMWWKRRPAGSLGVPPMPGDVRAFRGLLAILIIGGLVFPLVGASLLVMLALDFIFTGGAWRLGSAR